MSAECSIEPPEASKGGSAMSGRLKLALLTLASIIGAAAIGGVPWGP
jgi:hypothetical protein